MGRPKGALGKKTLAKLVAQKVEETAILHDFEHEEEMFCPPPKAQVFVPVSSSKANHPAICIGGPLSGQVIPGSKATRQIPGYIMREVKRYNPEPMKAGPESLWIYVPVTLNPKESTAIFVIDLYLELLKSLDKEKKVA